MLAASCRSRSANERRRGGNDDLPGREGQDDHGDDEGSDSMSSSDDGRNSGDDQDDVSDETDAERREKIEKEGVVA